MLQSRKEIDEPFEAKQIGSSAMAYKRNPMRAERMCSLSRFVISLQTNRRRPPPRSGWSARSTTAPTAGSSLPQAFLAIDAILLLYRNIVDGLVVYPQVIARNLARRTAVHGDGRAS